MLKTTVLLQLAKNNGQRGLINVEPELEQQLCLLNMGSFFQRRRLFVTKNRLILTVLYRWMLLFTKGYVSSAL